MSVWKTISKTNLGWLNSISNEIADLEKKCDNFLIDIRDSKELILVSDYSGQHKGAKVEAYSYLLTSFDAIWLWLELRKDFRKNFLANQRRMAFKALNDRLRIEALIPFLRIANSIPGLLFTAIIDKRIKSLFQELSVQLPPECKGFKATVLKRIQLIAAFGGLVLAGMSSPYQNLLWVTDEDEIAPNVDKFYDVTKLIGYCISHILSHNLGHIKIATTKSDCGNFEVEDLAAIPDIAAGALCEHSPLIMESLFESDVDEDPKFICGQATKKAEIIGNWFADGSCHALKKVIAFIGLSQNKIKTNCIHLMGSVKRPEFVWYDMAEEILRRYKT
jgi:hypothetical protein